MSKRTALISAGAVLTASGVAVVAAGVALAAVAGTDGTLSTGRHHHATTATAVVSGAGDLGGSTSLPFGDPELTVSVTGSDKPMFVGIGPAADVDRYLAGASVQTASDIDVWPFHLDTETRVGDRQPDSPLDQTFWVARSDGVTSAATSWKIADGSYRVVVMNADGSPGVDVDGSLAVRVPALGALVVTGLAGGGLLLASGVPLLVAGIRRKETAQVTATPVPEELTTVG